MPKSILEEPIRDEVRLTAYRLFNQKDGRYPSKHTRDRWLAKSFASDYEKGLPSEIAKKIMRKLAETYRFREIYKFLTYSDIEFGTIFTLWDVCNSIERHIKKILRNQKKRCRNLNGKGKKELSQSGLDALSESLLSEENEEDIVKRLIERVSRGESIKRVRI